MTDDRSCDHPHTSLYTSTDQSHVCQRRLQFLWSSPSWPRRQQRTVPPHQRQTNVGSAFIAAARRKDRSPEGKIESAKKSSEAHYEIHGRYFYLTVEIILGDKAFEDLEDLEQLDDPALILPEGADKTAIREEILQEKASQGLCPSMTMSQDALPFAGMNGFYAGSGQGMGGEVVAAPGQVVLQRVLSNSTTQIPSGTTTQTNTASPEDQAAMLDYLKDPDEVLDPVDEVELQHLPDEEELDDIGDTLVSENTLFGLDVSDEALVNGWINGYNLEHLSQYDSQHMFCNDLGQEEGDEQD